MSRELTFFHLSVTYLTSDKYTYTEKTISKTLSLIPFP